MKRREDKFFLFKKSNKSNAKISLQKAVEITLLYLSREYSVFANPRIIIGHCVPAIKMINIRCKSIGNKYQSQLQTLVATDSN